MEQNNKTLLIAVLIILLALVAFNFNNISGRPVTEINDASISVSPSIVIVDDRTSSGEFIDVVVDTGSVGLEPQMWLHRADGSRISGSSDRLCNTNLCNGVRSKRFFISQGNPSGQYFIRMSRGVASVDSNIFTVRHV